jgi:hypothetical protein
VIDAGGDRETTKLMACQTDERTVSLGAARTAGMTGLPGWAGLNALDFSAGLGFNPLRRLDRPAIDGLTMPSLPMERLP